MSAKHKIIVLGATGNVGKEMLKVVSEFNSLKNFDVVACASNNSLGKKVSCGSKTLNVTTLDRITINKDDIVLSAIGGENIAGIAEDITSSGAILIDNSSHFRMDSSVPLVIPEINASALDEVKKGSNKGIIANPNCSTIQMLVAVASLNKKLKIKRMVASTYQAVSGAGKDMMNTLFKQTKAMFGASPAHEPVSGKQIAFNCIPKIGKLLSNGYTDEEMKMVNETKKILEDDSIAVTSTCVRVPVFNCHGVSLNVEFENGFTMEDLENILYNSEGVLYMDDRDEVSFKTQIECSQTDAVFISRLRIDESIPNSINMWIVADNLRKGAALNAVQIAQEYIARNSKIYT